MVKLLPEYLFGAPLYSIIAFCVHSFTNMTLMEFYSNQVKIVHRVIQPLLYFEMLMSLGKCIVSCYTFLPSMP